MGVKVSYISLGFLNGVAADFPWGGESIAEITSRGDFLIINC